MPTRVLAYDRPFYIAVTFEINSTHYEVIRMELTYFDWLSAVGGLSSIIFSVSQLAGNLESAQMYATSAMFYDDHSDDDQS